jgi:hypothetical protein
MSNQEPTPIGAAIARTLNKRYVISNYSYHQRQRSLLALVTVLLIVYGSAGGTATGLILVVTFIVIAYNSKAVLTPAEREDAKQRFESRIRDEDSSS